MKNTPTVALVGNPNAGKTSLFNHLTGLNQKTGNFAGVTVEKKTGEARIQKNLSVSIIDLPGTYSLFPKTLDEQVVLDVLLNPQDSDHPDMVVVVADAANLKRNLLLFTQINDLGYHCILALTMLDVADRRGIDINIDKLSMLFGVPVVLINARTGEGVRNLKFAIWGELQSHTEAPKPALLLENIKPELLAEIKQIHGLENDYLAVLYATQYEKLKFLPSEQRRHLAQLSEKHLLKVSDFQSQETISRFESIGKRLDEAVVQHEDARRNMTERLDRWFLHPVWGYGSFLVILYLIFQAIFSFAEVPMDLIDGAVASFTDWVKAVLPPGWFSNLLTDGLLAGIGGVVVFIPQIALLSCFIALLEESGYMARVMVLMDKIMRKFGLNGRSVVPLISGMACAVPALMATRSIHNWKDRLITIMVTPLMSCSARLPIFTIIIALIVPNYKLWGLGILNLQGLALMGLYMVGFFSALVAAWGMKQVVKNTNRSYFVMELPVYQPPRAKLVALAVVNSVKAFALEAGKVIVVISMVLWALASYGPGNSMEQATQQITTEYPNLPQTELQNKISAARLENSYAGRFGKLIEPAIKPLGYDWKIGIALLTSFAAREVFVGTMSTIYSLGGNDEATETIREKMKAEINPETGQPMYSFALGASLLLFYLFAMQCMSTLATTYRETRRLRYPLIQLLYMTALAYLSAFVAYQVFK